MAAVVLPTMLRGWRRLKLWPRLVLAVTFGFLLLFGVFSALSLRAVNDSTNRILQERLVIAQMAAREIDRVVERGFYELEKATEFAAFDPQVSSLADEYHMLAHAYGRVGALSLGVYFLDAQGRVVLSEPAEKLPRGFDLASEAHIRAVTETGRRSVSEPFVDPTTGKPAVALTIPILRPDGALVSMLSGLIDLTSAEVMDTLTRARDLGHTGHAELVDSRGLGIAATDYGGFLKPGEHFEFYLRKFRDGGTGVETVPYTPWHPVAEQDIRHVMAFAPLTSAPWGVAVGGLDWETFAPMARLRNTLLLGGGLALALLWGVTLLGARLLVRPVQALTGAARGMASGNLEQPVQVEEGGEIGVLAESLEAMRAQLKASMEQVRRWGEELEGRVGERTEELASRNRQLAAITAIATAANEVQNQEVMLSRCLEVVLEHAEMETATVRLLEDGGRLVVARAQGDLAGFPCAGLAVGMGECPCGHVAAKGSAVYLSPEERDRFQPPCRAPQAQVLAVLPLKSPKGVLGILSLSRSHGAPPGPEQRETLEAICNQIAIAIENNRLLRALGEAEAQRQADRLKAEFMSAVSHELRTPLGFIKGYATTLLRDDIQVDPATRSEFVQVIVEESDKLQAMIEELLDASRLQAGNLGMDRRSTDLEEFMAGVLSKAATALRQSGHVLRVSLPPQPTQMVADPGRVEQVLHNLLDNAVKYSEPGSGIEVEAAVLNQEVVIGVKDHGDGIPAEETAHIFEPFYRGENARRRSVRGTGLGLAICRGIIESHGGRLWVESGPGNGGSAFYFTLPLARRDAPEAVEAKDSPRSAR